MGHVSGMMTGRPDAGTRLWKPEALALHDPLTGLPNHLLMREFLSGALGAARHGLGSVAVCTLDIDDFSRLNDTYGFALGDRLLVDITRRLRQCLRGHDFLARVGVDEFVIVAPGIEDGLVLERLCARIQDAITEPFASTAEITLPGGVHGHSQIYPQAAMGVAMSPRDAIEVEGLLDCSRLALAQARHRGPGTLCFFASDMERAPESPSLEGDLRHAILSGQFLLMYQPRWGTQNCELRGVEALIRWNHPKLGRLSPDDFIPLAEQSGLIIPIGSWVLRQACETIARLPGLNVSVNVSAVQFRNDDLVREVEEALADTGLPPHRLELEITESVLIENIEKARDVMARLKKLGVRLAMDDFGSGYSSLGYLRHFPFDALKIDYRFIDDLDRTPNGLAIVEAILGLGRALGMQVVAEGVGSASQLELLRRADCDEVQGFYLAPPMLIGELQSFMSRDDAPPVRPEAS